ncbi:hypothetical protein ENSA7_58500 [Enhygromyxa salina]|uniref:Uncharacterized protein n=1 Tax=Enhygromyxa salina TaxID=215803 RepID=A0A2S9Y818_9BACT|nr:hypothetical protein ENSA7_58500 [Enhygromyxa salina]
MRSILSKTLTFLAVGVLTLAASACRGPMPCPDCDEQADDDDSPPDLPTPDPLPDLPCGGADFMSDSYNCGSCGHECPLWYEGTEWEAGTCVAGVCGPVWSQCAGNSGWGGNTCGELCAGGGRTCVANGCSGFTALLLYTPAFDPCHHPPLFDPVGVMTGSCDEQIPWENDEFSPINVQCCCAP